MNDTNKAKPIVVDNDTFQRLVIESDGPVIVDFWAQWCRPCLALAPALEQLAGDLEGRISIAKLEVDGTGNDNVRERFGIKGLPSLLFFHKGLEVKRLMGAMPRAKLQLEIEQFLREQGLAENTASAAQQAAFDDAVKAAEESKEAQIEAAGAEHKRVMSHAFGALKAVRIELFKAIVDELDEAQKPTAQRAIAGEFDEAIYKLFVTVRGKIDEEERFKHLAERQGKAIKELNTGDGEKAKEAFFAAIKAADAAYNDAVEEARRQHLPAQQS